MMQVRQPRTASSAAKRSRSLAKPGLGGAHAWGTRFFTPEEHCLLEDAVSSCREVEAGTTLLSEGERASSLFVVTQGWACRYLTTGQRCRQLTALLVPGDIGNLETLLFERLDYGVVTITRATVVVFRRERMLALAAEHLGIARSFTWLALVENAILSNCAVSLGRRSARERLAHLLCELSVRLGGEHGNQSSFDFPLTQDQIADALGLSPIHVNRTMQGLRTEELVASYKKRVHLTNVSQLRHIAGFDPRYLHLEGPLSDDVSHI